MLRFSARWPLVLVAVAGLVSAVACGDLTSTVPIWGHPFERDETPQPGGVVPEPGPEPDVVLDHDVTDWGSISGVDLRCFSASSDRIAVHVAAGLLSQGGLNLALEFAAPFELNWQVDPGPLLDKTACLSGAQDLSFVVSTFNPNENETELHMFDEGGFLSRSIAFPFRPGWEAFFPYQAARTDTDIFTAGEYLDAESDTFDVFRYSLETGELETTGLFPFSTTRIIGLAATDAFLFVLSETDEFGQPAIQMDRRPVDNIASAGFASTRIEGIDEVGNRLPEGNRMLALGDGTIVFATNDAVQWRGNDLAVIQRWPNRDGEQVVALTHDPSSNLLYAAVTTPTQALVRYYSFDGPTGVAYREPGAGVFARGISDIRGNGVIFVASDRAIGNEQERATYTMSQISLR